MSQQKLTIIDAAQTIRYHLREILDDDAHAESLDRELVQLLKQVRSDENVKTQIRKVLNRHDAIKKWMRELLNSSDDTRKSYYSGLPGDPTQMVSGLKKYVCPEPNCSEYWYRKKVGQKIPKCPNPAHEPTTPVPEDELQS